MAVKIGTVRDTCYRQTHHSNVVSGFNTSVINTEVAYLKNWTGLNFQSNILQMQASFLVADDIMDQSETRRGKLCWYKNKGLGLQVRNAISSSFHPVDTLLDKRLL